jgi:tRNA (guanine-N7-)-methyltransferase
LINRSTDKLEPSLGDGPDLDRPTKHGSGSHIRSFVIRAGRMGSGQSKALKALSPSYLIPFSPGLCDDGATPTICATMSADSAHRVVLSDYWPKAYQEAPLIIEIGFGMGDALAAIAAADRSKRYLGIDVHPPGVGSMLQRIEDQRLSHVRLIQHDAVDVLEKMIADNSVTGFHIYFPDPWPKKRHHKRRLIQTEFVKRMSSCLKVGGYIHCATDWEPYAQWMLNILSAESSLMNQADGYHARPAWRPMTKFEARGLRLGHVVNDLLFRKR